MGDLAGVDDDLDLGDGVGDIGIVQSDREVQLLGDLVHDGAQNHAVDGVADFQVLVLGGVDPVIADGLVDALLGEVGGQDDVTGIVGVAPLALVVVLVVGGSHMPALVQSHGILLVAGVVAACTHLTLAVADLDQLDAGVDDGIPVGEVGEVAEGGAGVVELADGIHALRLAQQRVVGLHTGIGGLVVQDIVVAGDDAGGGEGVDVTGAAGPGHLEAADGDHVSLAGVEGGDIALVGVPQILTGSTCQAHVVESLLGIDGGGGVEVVGVVGEGHEIDVGALGQTRDVVQGGLQGARAVGVGGVGVELTEVELILRLAHGEAPGLGGGLAVGAGHGDGDGNAAVGHVGFGLPGDDAVLVNSLNGLAVHGHGDGGVLTGIDDDGGDDGALVLTGLGIGGGGDVHDGGLVHDLIGHGAAEHGAHGIHGGDIHADACAALVDDGGGNGDGVDAGNVGAGQGAAVLDLIGLGAVAGGIGEDLDRNVALQAEDGLDGEGEDEVLTLDGGAVAEDQLGIIDDAAHQGAHGEVGVQGVEEELVNVIVGDIVHGVGLVGVGIVFQVLAVGAVVLGGAGLQMPAAGLALEEQPVGILAPLLGVEGVVAGAVGAQIAVGLVVEAVVFAVSENGEDHGAVVGDEGILLHIAGDIFDGLGVILGAQDTLGAEVVDDDLVALGGQTGFGCGGILTNQIEHLGEERLVGADVVVGRPVVLVCVPLNVVAPGNVLDVEAVLGLGGFDAPGGVHIVQRHGGVAGAQGELLALAGCEGVGAVVVDAHGPDVGLGEAGELAIGENHGSTGVVVAGVGGGQSHQVGGVEDDDVVTVMELGDDTALLGTIHQVEVHAVGGVAVLDTVGGEAGVVLQSLVVVAIVVGAHIHDDPGAVILLLQGPAAQIGQLLGEGQAVAGLAGGQVFAVQGEDVVLTLHGDQQPTHLVGQGDGLVLRGSGDGGDLLAAGGSAHDGGVAGVIDEDGVAILGSICQIGGSLNLGLDGLRGLGIGGLGNHGSIAGHHIEAHLELSVGGGVGRIVGGPVAVLGVPLQVVAATGVLHIVQAVAQVGQSPVIVDSTQIHGGVGISHAQILTLVGEGEAAVAVVDDGEDLGIAVAGQNAVGQGHIHADVVIAGLDGGQSLAVGGGVDDDLIAVSDGTGGNDRLRYHGLGGSGLGGAALGELEQGDRHLIGVGGGFVVAEAHLVGGGVEAHVGAGAQSQIHAVIHDLDGQGILGGGALVGGGAELVGFRVVIQIQAAGGLEDIASVHGLDGHRDGGIGGDGVAVDGDGLVVVDCIGGGKTAVKGKASRLVHQQILARPVGLVSSDSGVGGRFCREDGGGEHGQHHDQRQHHRQESAEVGMLHCVSSFLLLRFWICAELHSKVYHKSFKSATCFVKFFLHPPKMPD